MAARSPVWFLIIVLGSVAVLAMGREAVRFAAAGFEFQINSTTVENQAEAAVSVAANGDIVVVWQSADSQGTDKDGTSVQGQRYASDGSVAGDEFQVNTYTTSFQYRPAVASFADGGFVVVWVSNGSAGTDTGYSVQGQRFASDGSAVANEFQVNTYTTSYQRSPVVATSADGGFVVVWTGYAGGEDGYGIRGQRYASDGSTAGGELVINTYTTGAQDSPSLGMDASGNFVVTWDSYDSSSGGVQAQRLASDGSLVGGEFQVNTYTTSSQQNSDVEITGDGSFVVVWQSQGSSGTDTEYTSIQGQRFAADGSALASEFQINTYTSTGDVIPAVDLDAAGNFTVVWQGNSTFSSSGRDGSSNSVAGRRYAADGAPIGDELLINTVTTGGQGSPDVAVAPNGDIVVVWDTEQSSGTDNWLRSVAGQRYALEADLSISKDDGVSAADPGGTVIYEIVAANAGPDAAVATVSDVFPAGLGCSWTSMALGGATGNTDSAGDLLDTLSMPAGSSVTYTATCAIDLEATGTLSNTATITSLVNDPNTLNNSATDDDTVLNEQANLSVAKLGPSVAGPSSVLIYSLTVENAGTLDATSVTLTETLPMGTIFLSATGGGFSCIPAVGMVTCTRALLAASDSAVVTVELIAPMTEGSISNTATVSAAEDDFDTSDNSSTFATDIVAPFFADGFESGNTSAWSNTVQ